MIVITHMTITSFFATVKCCISTRPRGFPRCITLQGIASIHSKTGFFLLFCHPFSTRSTWVCVHSYGFVPNSKSVQSCGISSILSLCWFPLPWIISPGRRISRRWHCCLRNSRTLSFGLIFKLLSSLTFIKEMHQCLLVNCSVFLIPRKNKALSPV